MKTRIDYFEGMEVLQQHRTNQIVIPHEMAVRAWPKVSKSPKLDVSILGCMSKASNFGLGVALGRPDRGVWVIDGDGALLMNLGCLVTEAHQAPNAKNFVHILWENDMYETTGQQPLPGGIDTDFAAFAKAAGFPRTYTFEDRKDLDKGIAEALDGKAMTFIAVKVTPCGDRKLADYPRMVDTVGALWETLKTQ